MERMGMSYAFWKGRRVFLTGHTGFKGSWLSLWLHNLGAEVIGFSLQPPTEPSLFTDAHVARVLRENIQADIRDTASLTKAMRESSPEIVIHMAAQSLVRESYRKPVETYSTNVMGTVNVYEAVRQTPEVSAVLNITTDKCYENCGRFSGYRENDPLGGRDPYSSSKSCSELITTAYRRSFFQETGVALATARAGNVIGGGDWATDRIVPDAMRAFESADPLRIRNPMATRPWQHVLEPLTGYLTLCQQLIEHPKQCAEAWNFGPNEEDIQPVSRLADMMVAKWGEYAAWGLDGGAHPHEEQYLKLDCSKAKSRLNWEPIWNLERAIEETVKWYQARSRNEDMHKFTLCQIEAYQQERQIR